MIGLFLRVLFIIMTEYIRNFVNTKICQHFRKKNLEPFWNLFVLWRYNHYFFRRFLFPPPFGRNEKQNLSEKYGSFKRKNKNFICSAKKDNFASENCKKTATSPNVCSLQNSQTRQPSPTTEVDVQCLPKLFCENFKRF